MTCYLLQLWDDDCGGALLSAEWLMMFTTLILGGLTGMVAVRQALVSEWTEAAQSLLSRNPSFSFSGQRNCDASAGGMSASDTTSAAASLAALNQKPMD